MHPLLYVLFAANVDPSALASCAVIEDDRQRLYCYDALMRPSGRAVAATESIPAAAGGAVSSTAVNAGAAAAPAAGGATAAAVAAAPAVAAATVNPVEEFGLSDGQRLAKQQPVQAPQEVDSINSRVAVVRKLRDDRFVLILENDQIWTQAEPTPRQRFYVGDEIRIRRASLGSFLATGPYSGGAIRFRRVE